MDYAVRRPAAYDPDAAEPRLKNWPKQKIERRR